MNKTFVHADTSRGPSKPSRVAISDHIDGKDVGTDVARGMMETLEVDTKTKKTITKSKEKAENAVDSRKEKAAKNKEKVEKEVDA